MMKRKTCKVIVFAILMIAIMLSARTLPVFATNTYYFWDGVYFLGSAQTFVYPHPDRDYYGINPFAIWHKYGNLLLHFQVDAKISPTLAGLGPEALGTAIGALLASPGGIYAEAVGAVAGLAIGAYLALVANIVLLDESNCMWVWISTAFINWVADYWWLGEAAALVAFYLYGYLRVGSVTVYDAVGAGSPAPPSGGGGGCPYVYTYEGHRYVMDNNLLPASEISQGADVEDYYRLEQRLVPTYQGTSFSLYSLQICEFEYEHDYFDQTKLFAVDHDSNVNVGVSPYGEILTYTNPDPPMSAFDETGINVLSLVNSIDGSYYQGHNGSYITLTFNHREILNGIKLVIREDDHPPMLKCPVNVQVLNATGCWNTVATFFTRTYWATDIINMTAYLPDPEGNLKVRLCFIANNKIDYIGLDTSPQSNIQVYEASLILAFHSEQGIVTPLLTVADEHYAELTPGQQIKLTFRLPNNRSPQRTFILYTKGHYGTITP